MRASSPPRASPARSNLRSASDSHSSTSCRWITWSRMVRHTLRCMSNQCVQTPSATLSLVRMNSQPTRAATLLPRGRARACLAAQSALSTPPMTWYDFSDHDCYARFGCVCSSAMLSVCVCYERGKPFGSAIRFPTCVYDCSTISFCVNYCVLV